MRINHSVIPTVFTDYGKWGDWAWMQTAPAWAHTLFVFNDNEEQFDAFVNGLPRGFTPGAGNAIARPWRKFNPPKSAGIPTGRNGVGYTVLDSATKEKIDQALTLVYDLSKKFYYQYLVFSADETRTSLGTGTFKVDDEVRQYIFDRLSQTPDEWKQFIADRKLQKFRELRQSIEDAHAQGIPTDASNPKIEILRDELKAIFRLGQF